jgi:zinc-ribbon domain
VYCVNCGIELADNAKFCSSCGNNQSNVPPRPLKRDWDLHVTILGWLVIAHAALIGLMGLVVMFGGQFVRRLILDNPRLLDRANPNDLPPEFQSLIVPITFLIGVLLLMIAMPSIAAGVGLLRYRSWGRILTLVLSFVRLLEFPLGTITAIYSFWVLLSKGGKSFFNERAARAEG